MATRRTGAMFPGTEAAFDAPSESDTEMLIRRLGWVPRVTALPTAAVKWRGRTLRVDGAAGVADHVYACLKSAADTYSWVVVATG